MHDKKELCKRITSLYPLIGECGIDLTVNYDPEKKAWAVDLKKGGHELRHYLEVNDADACMDGRECVSLGLEIAQLQKNIKSEQF